MSGIERAIAVWPGVGLSPSQLEQDLERLGCRHALPPHVEHVALCSACARKCPVACGILEEQFVTPLRGTIGRVRSDDDFIQEVLQVVRELLLSGPRPGIRTYSGRGPLLGWLRVVARREALRLAGAQGTPQRAVDWLSRVDGVSQEPETLALQSTYAPVFRHALTEVLTTLKAEDRNMLRLQLVEGLSPAALSDIFGIHVASVYRRVSRCHRSILEALRRRLRRELGHLSQSEIHSLFRMTEAQLNLSLTRILGASPATGEPAEEPPRSGGDGAR